MSSWVTDIDTTPSLTLTHPPNPKGLTAKPNSVNKDEKPKQRQSQADILVNKRVDPWPSVNL